MLVKCIVLKNIMLMTMMIGITLSSTHTTFAASEGHETGNGGDSYAEEFVTQGLIVANFMKAMSNDPTLVRTQFSGLLLEQTIHSTLVFSEDHVYLGSNEVDGENFPSADPKERKIIINRSRWDALSPYPNRKRALVVHEYLSIFGMEKNSYDISVALKGIVDLVEDPHGLPHSGGSDNLSDYVVWPHGGGKVHKNAVVASDVFVDITSQIDDGVAIASGVSVIASRISGSPKDPLKINEGCTIKNSQILADGNSLIEDHVTLQGSFFSGNIHIENRTTITNSNLQGTVSIENYCTIINSNITGYIDVENFSSLDDSILSGYVTVETNSSLQRCVEKGRLTIPKGSKLIDNISGS